MGLLPEDGKAGKLQAMRVYADGSSVIFQPVCPTRS